MALAKAARILGGEVVVSPSGIYTFAHFYRHSRSARSVILVGTNHFGDEEYFRTVGDILFGCDLVLFEGSIPEEEDLDERGFLEAARGDFFGEDPELAFGVAFQLYFVSAQRVLGLSAEDAVFDYRQSHWISGEPDFLTDRQKLRLTTKFSAKMKTIPFRRKKAVVDFVRRSLDKMDRGDYTVQDLGKGLAFFWTDTQLVGAVSDTIGKPRDRNCLKVFDAVVRERDPRLVGIVFGAGHTAFQRQLLEERGYVLESSMMLCNVRF